MRRTAAARTRRRSRASSSSSAACSTPDERSRRTSARTTASAKRSRPPATTPSLPRTRMPPDRQRPGSARRRGTSSVDFPPTTGARSSITSSGSMRRSPEGRGAWSFTIAVATIATLTSVMLFSPAMIAHAQSVAQSVRTAPDTMGFYKALDLESSGNYQQAAPLFREAIGTTLRVQALLGLERAYAELGHPDSLLAPLDTLIAAYPHEPTFRTVQLRTLQTLGKSVEERQ